MNLQDLVSNEQVMTQIKGEINQSLQEIFEIEENQDFLK